MGKGGERCHLTWKWLKRVLDETLPNLETPDPTDSREQMAPGQVQAHKLCFQKFIGDSGKPLEKLI